MSTHQSSLRLDEGPILSVHLVVESAGVAEVVSGTVPPPQRRRRRAAVDALATLCECVCVHIPRKREKKRVECVSSFSLVYTCTRVVYFCLG